MKKLVLLFALTALAVPAFGRNLSRLSRMTQGSAATLSIADAPAGLPAHLIAQVHAAARARRAQAQASATPKASRLHTTAITDSISARAFIIPAAGSLAAGGGALFFKSDVTLTNYAAVDQPVLVGFWKQGETNNIDNLSAFKTLTLGSNQFVTIQDFVATAMNTSGLGSLVFIPFRNGDFDPNAAIDGFSRIYTKQPGSTGTVSQPFDAIDPDTLSVQLIDEGVALGLRQDANFRTNFGIVNVDAKQHVYKLTFLGEKLTTTNTYTVPPYGMIQTSIPTGDYGALQIVYQVTDAGEDFVSWVGYASSTDNVTGDGWVSIVSADFTPDDLDQIGY